MRASMLGTALALSFVAALFGANAALAEAPHIHVYKSASCGCCTKWIEHLEANGFAVAATNAPSMENVKLENGIPNELASCHTAFVGGYVIEGHVPAADIQRLLREKPPIAGLAVPDMPIGSPGMEGPNPEPYQVLSFGPGGTGVFSEHRP